MIQIDRLMFVNYRQYGTGEINFSKRNESDTYLFAFIAQNGTGKTTILKAINWCLYGNEYQDPSGKLRSSNIEKLDKQALPLVNTKVLEMAKANDEISVSVSLRFVDEEKNVIEFTRNVRFKKHIQGTWTMYASQLDATVTPSDGNNTITLYNDEADSVVKQYFDPAISNFYFFDGEKLADFFYTPLKKSIYNIAQVTMLENTINHTENIRRSYNRQLGKELPDIGDLQRDIEAKEAAVKAYSANLENERSKIKRLQNNISVLDQKLSGYRPVEKLQKRRNELIKKHKELEEEKAKLMVAQSAFIREYLVVLRMYPLAKKVYDYISEKRDKGELPPALDRNAIKELLDHPEKPCPLCGGHVSEAQRKHLEELLKKFAISSATSNSLSSMMGPLETILSEARDYKNRKNTLLEAKKKLYQRWTENERTLSGIDEQISKFGGDEGIKEITTLNKSYNEKNAQLAKCRENVGTYKLAAEIAERDLQNLQKKLEDYEEKAAIQSEVKAKLKVLSEMQKSFQKVKDAIVRETEKEMQDLTWKYFQSMIWKKNTFGKIIIDDDYNVTVYDQAGRTMTESMSATEKMALAYAFTLAVHRVSGRNCPLVIDSPLGRVSDDNRENMARALLKVAKDKQIIMLFTPDEYSPAVAEMYNKEATTHRLSLSADESLVEGVER